MSNKETPTSAVSSQGHGSLHGFTVRLRDCSVDRVPLFQFQLPERQVK